MRRNNQNQIEQSVLEIDDSEVGVSTQEVIIPSIAENTYKEPITKEIHKEPEYINCLKNERVLIRHIPKEGGLITNPKHILYGGMAEGSKKYFVVPRLSSGMFVNVLTDTEKSYLENIMGLENNALSIYRKVDNFWDDSNDNGISRVRLQKQDNYLNLADPEDYIRYKILIANKDYIAPSIQHLQDYPKATYQYVIISEGEENKNVKENMNIKMMCYKEYWKLEDDIHTLRTIAEIIENKPTSPSIKLEFLQARMDNLIVADSKLFYRIITDKLLPTKVLIKKAIEAGIISNRGGMLYMMKDGSPLCEHNEEPTLNIAATYLNSPKRQEIKFAIEAQLK